MELAAVLRWARKEKLNWSRAELAKQSGIHESTIAKIEENSNENPGVFTVAALAIAMRVDLGDLLVRRTGRLPRRLLGPQSKSDSGSS